MKRRATVIEKTVTILFLAGLLINGLLGFGTSMTFLWPGYVALGLAAAAGILLLKRKSGARFGSGGDRGPGGWCLPAAFLLAGFVALRACLSPVAYFAREDLALLGAWFVTYLMSATVLCDSRWKRWMIGILAALTVANIVMAFWQYSRDPSVWILPGYARTYLDRSGGVFDNPNHLAGFLAAVTPMFFGLAAAGRINPQGRLLLGFLGLLSIITLSLTKSRGGILAMAVGLAVLGILLLWLFRGTWRRKAGLAIAGLLVGAATVAGLGTLHFDILGKRFGAGAYSAIMETNRPPLWQSALEQNALSPLIGTGSRSFSYYSRKFRSPEMHVSAPEAEFAHNEYLQMAADYGWIGLALALGFVLLHGWSGLGFLRGRGGTGSPRESVHPSDRLALAAGALAGLAALGVHAALDFLLHVPAIAMTAALLLGFLANPDSARAAKTMPSREIFLAAPTLAGRLAAIVAGGALVYSGTIFARSEWHYERARLVYAGNLDISVFGHLRRSRELDPRNPFAQALSGHVHLSALEQSMPVPVMKAYLQKALGHFETAVQLYPADVYARIGLASCLDAVGRRREAEEVLSRAREWAPLYGTVMHAQATHFYRLGDLDRAEILYREAERSAAFRDWQSASRAIAQIQRDRQQESSPPGRDIAGREETDE